MLARKIGQRLPLTGVEHPAQRIVQRRHGIHRPHPPLLAQRLKRLKIRSLRPTGDRRQLQMIQRRQNLEARIGQRIHRHHIPRT
ncbi:Uncharacterised protein [Klebsiella pneumoniae]|nr:Uncharacterised protein [Klebsiella pneumoniae]